MPGVRNFRLQRKKRLHLVYVPLQMGGVDILKFSRYVCKQHKHTVFFGGECVVNVFLPFLLLLDCVGAQIPLLLFGAGGRGGRVGGENSFLKSMNFGMSQEYFQVFWLSGCKDENWASLTIMERLVELLNNTASLSA